jgi:hypothetical protein
MDDDDLYHEGLLNDIAANVPVPTKTPVAGTSRIVQARSQCKTKKSGQCLPAGFVTRVFVP